MEYALTTLLVALLIFPGFVGRIFYLQGPHGKRTSKTSVIDEIVLSILPAVLINILGVSFINASNWFALRFDADILFGILYGQGEDSIKAHQASTYLIPFSEYIILINTFAATLGIIARWLTTKLGFDIRYSFLRNNNDWFYKLDREYLKRAHNNQSITIICECWIDIGDKISYIKGELGGFTTLPDDELKSLELSSIIKSKDIPFGAVNSNNQHTVIEYSNVKALRITYL